MELGEIGLDNWFKDQAGELCGPGATVARVTAVDRDRYIIRNEQGERDTRRTHGSFSSPPNLHSDLPCVGDWVCAHSR